MGVIKVFVQAKEKESLEVAKETERLYLEGLNYNAALIKAKKMYENSKNLKEVDELIKDAACKENKSPEDVLNNICEVLGYVKAMDH